MNKWIVVTLLIAASAADAGVHKCQAPDGKITYTDTGCPQGQDVGARQAEERDGGASKEASGSQSSAGRQDVYRENVKAAERAAPKSDQPRP